MSVDKSLKTKGRLERHRNVLSRAERIVRLKELDRWEEERSPFGLPKVAHRKAAVGAKEKTKKAEGTEAAAAGTPAAAAAEPKKVEAKKESPKKEAGKKEAGKK